MIKDKGEGLVNRCGLDHMIVVEDESYEEAASLCSPGQLSTNALFFVKLYQSVREFKTIVHTVDILDLLNPC